MEEYQAFLIVGVHHNGTFLPNLLLYFSPDITSIRDVDVNDMTFLAFNTYVEKLIDFNANMCISVNMK